ncbi:MAG: hypothetical protein WBD40_05430 [Tepidisphaeraceae bacterium]
MNDIVGRALKASVAIATLACACGLARGQNIVVDEPDSPDAPDFSLGIGYAYVSVGDSDSVLHSENALRFDSAASFSPFANLPQLRLGAAFGVAMVLDNSQRTIISNGGLIIAGSSSIPLLLLEPEARLSWRQYFGDADEFFVEPGVGVGGVFANLSVDADDSSTGESFDEWESAFTARAFVNVGFEVTGGVAGIQASYMQGGDLDFAENAGGDVSEFYIGVFGALRF